MRTFNKNNDANRSDATGKFEFVGFRHPLVENSFGKYMNKHRIQEDGKLRKSNNWWGGWDKSVSIQSLVRHCEDLQAIYAGYDVCKIRDKNGEETRYTKMGTVFNLEEGQICEMVTEEDCLNAIKFNCNAYLLNIL